MFHHSPDLPLTLENNFRKTYDEIQQKIESELLIEKCILLEKEQNAKALMTHFKTVLDGVSKMPMSETTVEVEKTLRKSFVELQKQLDYELAPKKAALEEKENKFKNLIKPIDTLLGCGYKYHHTDLNTKLEKLKQFADPYYSPATSPVKEHNVKLSESRSWLLSNLQTGFVEAPSDEMRNFPVAKQAR